MARRNRDDDEDDWLFLNPNDNRVYRHNRRSGRTWQTGGAGGSGGGSGESSLGEMFDFCANIATAFMVSVALACILDPFFVGSLPFLVGLATFVIIAVWHNESDYRWIWRWIFWGLFWSSPFIYAFVLRPFLTLIH